MAVMMTIAIFISSPSLENFFLVCFGIGFVLSLISFLAGAAHLHLPAKWHLPHFHFGHHAGHFTGTHGGAHNGAGKLPMKGAPLAADSGAVVDFTHVSAFNFPSLMAFLAWFGAVGYLTVHQFGMGLVESLVFSVVGGLLGGWIVYMYLRKLMSYDGSIDPADYEIVGAVGTVTVGIRENGTGELVYVQGGARKTCAARSEDGKPIVKGAEVAVAKYEKGVAYVREWEEFTESK